MARATAHALILACPPGHVRTVTGTLTTYGLNRELAEPFPEPGDVDPVSMLLLNTPYVSTAEPAGTAWAIGSYLAAHAPSVAFLVWEDPTHGQLGTLVAYVPGLPSFSGDCDSTGDLMISARSLLAKMGSTPLGMDLLEFLGRGVPVMRLIEKLRATTPVTVVYGPEGGSDD